MTVLTIEPLTKAAFAPFGDVIETAAAADVRTINSGFAQRFHDLARIRVGADGGWPITSIFQVQPRPVPIEIGMLEQHPLGSQAFVPLDLGGAGCWLLVVASGSSTAPDSATLRAFRASALQGVNYAPGTWHFPLLVLAPATFLVIDRDGPGNNLVETPFEVPYSLVP